MLVNKKELLESKKHLTENRIKSKEVENRRKKIFKERINSGGAVNMRYRKREERKWRRGIYQRNNTKMCPRTEGHVSALCPQNSECEPTLRHVIVTPTEKI